MPVALMGMSFRPRQAVSRPNILWIMTDQQPAGWMSCAGCSDVHTPAMDSLAAAGVRFELAYCANPICVPSRTSMITGHASHETGVTFNTSEGHVGFESLGTRMTRAGYDTGYIGKWHIPMPTEPGGWHGFTTMIEGGIPGFNDEDAVAPMVDFIRKERSQPFFLVASFVNPHDICEYARKLAKFGRREELLNGSIPDAPPPEECPALPANFAIPENEPEIIRDHQSWVAAAYPVRDWSDGTWRQYRWGLSRLTELADAHIQTLLNTLRDTGLDQNTVIVFVSDHGDGSGAHKWNQKTLLYDETVRVPCIISDPGTARPERIDSEHLVNTGLDLLPTFCDYAGIEPPEGIRGRSLRPLVEDRPVAWRDQVVAETDLYRVYGASGGVYGRMLRTERCKYIVYSEGKLREQLFDMQADPGEMNNLAVDPAFAAILEDHRRRLAKHMAETGDEFPVPGVAEENSGI